MQWGMITIWVVVDRMTKIQYFRRVMVDLSLYTYGKLFRKALVTTQALSAHHSRLCTGENVESSVNGLKLEKDSLNGPEIMQETTEEDIPLDEIEIDENLRFVKEPIEIVERDVKKLKRRRIPLVKVRWNSRQGAEYTWEREDQFQKKYPHLFSEPVPSSSAAT
ncbi:hypothetical protein Tco_0071182 [Tanacetum coccineum]